MKRFIKVAAVCSLIAGILWASGIAPQAYNRIQQAAANLTQRTILNFTGTAVTCVDNAGAQRTDCTINGTGMANFTQSFVSQTTVTLTHNLATTAVLTDCFDNASPPNLIIPQNIAITNSNVVTVTFSSSQSGSCVVNGAAAGTASSVPFSGVTPASNGSGTFTISTGGTLNTSGSGVINANQFNGVTYGTLQSWQKVTVGFASLTNAGLTQTINLVATGTRVKSCGVSVKHTAAFTGGTVSAMTVSVGDAAGSATTYTATFNIFQAPGNTVFQDTAELTSATYAASTIQAFFTATGGNLNTLAAGSVDFDICTVTIP
jgi:hypothetical protein